MLEIDLVGAEVLGPDGVHDDALSLAQGHICAERTGRQIDLTGYRVLPGIIDVHGDGFERHMAPRRGAMKQPAEGLFAVEAELAANGITTGVLAQFVSWEGGLRSLEFADQVFCALRDTKSDLVTDLRPQLRFEVSLLELYDGLPAQIAEWNVGYVVFNDHLPHDRLAEGRKPPRLTGQALKAGRNPDAHFQMLLDLHAKVGQAQAALGPLCAQLAKAGVRMGSHDDNTADGHNTWQARGIRVAEFPETQDAAEAAKAAGSTVVLGAPNLVRGGSHSGNVAASELAQFDLLDVLSSDYVPASLLMGALLLADQWDDMARGMATVTSAPAQHAGLTDRGTLREGQRADLVRGGSHKGNVSALDLVAMGLCDALASDYHYPSPRRAALMLARSGVMDLAAAWALVSSGPAAVLGLEDRGTLAPGKRADIVVLDARDRVAATLSGGRISYMSGDIAARFLAG